MRHFQLSSSLAIGREDSVTLRGKGGGHYRAYSLGCSDQLDKKSPLTKRNVPPLSRSAARGVSGRGGAVMKAETEGLFDLVRVTVSTPDRASYVVGRGGAGPSNRPSYWRPSRAVNQTDGARYPACLLCVPESRLFLRAYRTSLEAACTATLIRHALRCK